MHRVSLMQAMCIYRHGQRLRSAEFEVAKRALKEFADVSKVSQPSPIAPKLHGVTSSLLPFIYLFALTLLHSV